MRTRLVGFICVVLFALARANMPTEYGPSCSTGNECAAIWDTPFCRLTSGGISKCVECLSDEHCPAGQWCVSADFNMDPYGPYLIGQCADRNAPLNRRCDSALSKAAGNVIQGVNDQLFCGLVTEWSAPTNTTPSMAAVVQWEGACVEGVCYECKLGDAVGNTACYTFGVAGMGGSFHRVRVPGFTIFDISQNALSQLAVVQVVLTGLILLLIIYKHHKDCKAKDCDKCEKPKQS